MKYSKKDIRRAMALYAVTDRSWLREGETLADVCRNVLEHGATFLQLREKEMDVESIQKEARELKELCAAFHVPFVVNDSVETALAVDADGVHVGQSDIQGRDIRALIGPDRILGMTARTVEEARAAEAAGADYIGSGAVFGSSTKKNAKNLPLETLRDICASVSIPVVAIGGIGKENIRKLAGCGIAGAAVVSAVFGAEDPGRAAEELLALSREIIRHA